MFSSTVIFRKTDGSCARYPMPWRARLIHRGAGEVLAVEQHLALVGPDQPGNQVERRGLPRAVGAQQPDDLALLQADAHIVHDLPALEGLAEVQPFQHAAARKRPAFMYRGRMGAHSL